MSVIRIVQRREWREACTPVFNQRSKMRYAEQLGTNKTESLRTTWQEWRRARTKK